MKLKARETSSSASQSTMILVSNRFQLQQNIFTKISFFLWAGFCPPCVYWTCAFVCLLMRASALVLWSKSVGLFSG